MDPLQFWRSKGRYDATRGKGPSFRDTRQFGIIPVLDGSQTYFASREEEVEAGRAYLSGYNSP